MNAEIDMVDTRQGLKLAVAAPYRLLASDAALSHGDLTAMTQATAVLLKLAA